MNPHPRYSQQAQCAAFNAVGPVGRPYIEDRSGKVIKRLIESVRHGSVVRVVRPFLLAPIRGRTKTRRVRWTERVEAIKARGGKVEALGGITGARMAMLAYEEIGRSGQGALGQAKQGRPGKKYTPEQLIIIEREWHSKKHKTRDDALKAIRSYGIEVKREWLYVHFPVSK